MLAFFVEVRSVLAPRVEISDQFELLARPGMKWMGNSETSIQTACILVQWYRSGQDVERRLMLELRAEATDEKPLFRSRNKGGALTRTQVWRIVLTAAPPAKIKLNVSAHWLRHAHASHALDRGAPIHLVQATLGHASIATTGCYTHAPTQGRLGQVPDGVTRCELDFQVGPVTVTVAPEIAYGTSQYPAVRYLRFRLQMTKANLIDQ
jgi:hypothetical protein